MSETCWMPRNVTGTVQKNLRDDFDFDLEFRDILFFYTESRQILMQKREYHEIQDQNQNRP